MAGKVVTKITGLPKLDSTGLRSIAVQRVAGYARVSTGHEEQQTSMEAQVDYYQKFISGRPGWTLVQVYADKGLSGLETSKRDSFNKMIADCEAGKIDLILTKSISRFARNTVDTITTIRKLKANGVGVYFEKESIFTLDSKGEFLLTLMSSLAQEESRSISENIKWGQRKRFADGKPSVAYSRFLGYDRGGHKYEMVVNEEQAAVVRRIFYLFIRGYTPFKIAKLLEIDGRRTGTGSAAWCASAVFGILTNEKYKGDALLQKEFTVDFLQKKMKKNEGELPQYYIEGDHEAIIAPWLFDYVQKLLKKRSGLEKEKYSGMTCLNSKIICEKCGAHFRPRPWHSTTYNDRVWQCHNFYRKPKPCKTLHLYEELLFYLLHDTARNQAIKRQVVNAVEKIICSVTDEAKHKAIGRWLDEFKEKSAWELLADEEDILLVIDEITVTSDGRLKMRLLDGKRTSCKIPKYSPRRGFINENKTKRRTNKIKV